MVASGYAKTSDIVIQNGEKEGLPAKLCEACAYCADYGSDDENNHIEPVKVGKEVFPTKRWESLCRFERMFNVIVGDVDVGWDVDVELWRL